jgi:putative ATPase
VRELVQDAERVRVMGRGTVLFCDEIHRFNRAQQDAFLPHVERGTVTLVGATTENPSFELNAALLSRCQVYVLQPLDAAAIEALLDRALTDRDRGLGHLDLTVEPGAFALLAEQSDGDARRALTVLEGTARLVGPRGAITREGIVQSLGRRVAAYDKNREEHFNMLSAYHKSLRGSDPQGALYWMARMLEGGEDPMTLFRRAIAMAAEDIGLADPEALKLAIAARDAFQCWGGRAPAHRDDGVPPRRRSTRWWGAARVLDAARRTPASRSAPSECADRPDEGSRLRGGYRYAHDSPTGSCRRTASERLRGRALRAG